MFAILSAYIYNKWNIKTSSKMGDNVFLLSFIIWCLFIQTCVHGLCTNSNHTISCKHGELPSHISPDVRVLLIEQFDLNHFNIIQFRNVSSIVKLDIQADHGILIPANSFYKFTNLTYLGLHGQNISLISPDAFLGLNHLLTLNLSSNPKLHIHQVSSALNSEKRGKNTTVLPRLLSLSVAKIKTSFSSSVELDSQFFKSVTSGRKLKHLDLSELNIFRIDYKDCMPLCKSVEYLDVRKSVIGSALNYQYVEACESLRTFDISGVVIPALRILKFSFNAYHFSCDSWNIYTYIETLLVNNINTEHDIVINDYMLDMSTCPLELQKASLVGNRIKWINMTVKLHEATKKSFTESNISYNGLEYMSPSVLLPSENIRILDLSNNKLNVMQEKYTKEFERLFWAQTKLLYLNLSHNKLSKIPMQTFLKNKLLKVADISYNNIKHLDFSMNQFVQIERFIASHNKIHIIEQDIRMKLQMTLLRTHDQPDSNGSSFIYLEANPFQCTCDKMNMRLIEWLHSTKVIDKREEITCSLEEKVVDVRGTGLTETKHFCRMKTIMKIVWISMPFVLIAVILGIIIIVFIRRRRKRNLIIRKVIAQIEIGTFPLPYLAFLSHCGEDTDLVVNKIYPELCKHLTEVTHSNKSLVCLGDKHFRPGFPLRCEVMRCIEESSVMIAIISRNFCGKTYCNIEMKEAYEQDKPIIMLMVEHVEKELMDDYLQKIFDRYAHASWKPDDNGGHIEPEWKLFCKSIIQLAGQSFPTAHSAEIPTETIN